MKHDTLNLDAPHTMRELDLAESEAGAMRAKQIAAMVSEDAYLDRGDIGKATTGADKASALLAVWLETPNEGDPMIDVLLCTIRTAHKALTEGGSA